MPYCKSCGYELSNPAHDLHDPDNLMGVVDGGVESEDAHIDAKDGPNGARLFCNDTGQLTSIVNEPKDKEGEGGDPNQKQEQKSSTSSPESNKEPSSPPKEKGDVYSMREDKNAQDVLEEVVTAPFLDLSEGQLAEMKDWSDDYDGQIPPDTLEDILGNFKGVQKQTAKLARQKYEVKLNKWVRQQQRDDGSPPIGITQYPSPSGGNGGNGGSGQPRQRPSRGRGQEQQKGQKRPEGAEQSRERQQGQSATSNDLREHRRARRIKRRNDALDKAAAEFADQAAAQMAQDLGGIFGDARDIAYTAFKKKAEKDPDWFFEKMDKWDMDMVDVLLEPSEARKEQMDSKSGSPDASNVDEALDAVMEQEPAKEEQSKSDINQEPNVEDGGLFNDGQEPPEEGGDNMSAAPEEEAFAKHFEE